MIEVNTEDFEGGRHLWHEDVLGVPVPELPPRKTQGVQKSCVPTCAAWMAEYLRMRREMPRVGFSAPGLFSRVPQDQNGVAEGDVIRETEERGFDVSEITGDLFLPNITLTPDNVRASFRAMWNDLGQSFEAAVEFLSMNQPVLTGITWKFGYRVDEKGWLDATRTETQAGFAHALAAFRPAFRVSRGELEWGLTCVNPMGVFSKKTGGVVVIPESMFVADQAHYYALSSVDHQRN